MVNTIDCSELHPLSTPSDFLSHYRPSLTLCKYTSHRLLSLPDGPCVVDTISAPPMSPQPCSEITCNFHRQSPAIYGFLPQAPAFLWLRRLSGCKSILGYTGQARCAWELMPHKEQEFPSFLAPRWADSEYFL